MGADTHDGTLMDIPSLPLDRTSIFFDGLDHPECVAVHPDGSVWAGGEAGQIYRISPDGASVEEIARTGGFTLGIAFSPDASWLCICDLKQKCLWRLDIASAHLHPFAEGELSIPNYPVFDRDGTLYVSDSGAFRQVNGRILRFEAGSETGSVWHGGPFNFANGMAMSPAEDVLYVVCSWLPGVERVEILPDGLPGKRSVVARLPRTVPDGCAFDDQGNLYVSCYAPSCIYRITPEGETSLLIDDWEAHMLCNPTNIAFAGTRLLAANLGRWHLTTIDVGRRGAPLACHAR